MLETEPEVLMPKLTVETNRTVGLIAGFLVPYLHEHGLADGVDGPRGGRLPGPDDPVLHLGSRTLGPGRPRRRSGDLVRPSCWPGVVAVTQTVDR